MIFAGVPATMQFGVMIDLLTKAPAAMMQPLAIETFLEIVTLAATRTINTQYASIIFTDTVLIMRLFMFTDTHCHLNRLDLTKYDGQLSGAIDAMKTANVTRAMAIMCDFAEYDDIANIVSTYSDEALHLGMSVGIHPCEDIGILQSATVERLIDTAKADHVWAIGETGLDYYWSTENKKEQQDSLARHIHASQYLKKPLVIHMREAKEDTIDILKSEGAEHGIIHCFTEDWETAKRALDYARW